MKSAAPAVTREHDEDETSGDSSGPPGRLRAAVWFIAAAASFLQAWANRFLISPDGNNYLDIATAYLRHDWGTAINGWWSPMFSWILAGNTRIGTGDRPLGNDPEAGEMRFAK